MTTLDLTYNSVRPTVTYILALSRPLLP